MKKKFLACFMIAALACGMCACGGNSLSSDSIGTNDIQGESQTDSSVNDMKEIPLILEYEGQPAVNENRFGELFDVVDLTTENWRDYISILTYDEEIINKNAFGEIVYEKDENGEDIHNFSHHVLLATNTDKYYYFNNVIIELVNKESGESLILTMIGNGADILTESTALLNSQGLDAFDCVRIQGNLIFVDLPSEVVCTPLKNWDYDCGFELTNSNKSICTPFRINTFTKGIFQNGSDDWVEKYVQREN